MLTKDDRRAILDLLKQLKIIDGKETGKIIVNMNQGGITSIERVTNIS